METVTVNLYSFDELTEQAKEIALIKNCEINVDHSWWDFTYEDAKNVGIKITSFDCYRNELDAEFLYAMDDIASKIMFDHGNECQTYILSEMFLKSRDELVSKYSDGITTDYVLEDNWDQFDEDLEELEQEYMQALKMEYLSILEKEYEYLTGSESIAETLRINEYQFTEDGSIF
jgi:hypothetical protein